MFKTNTNNFCNKKTNYCTFFFFIFLEKNYENVQIIEKSRTDCELLLKVSYSVSDGIKIKTSKLNVVYLYLSNRFSVVFLSLHNSTFYVP